MCRRETKKSTAIALLNIQIWAARKLSVYWRCGRDSGCQLAGSKLENPLKDLSRGHFTSALAKELIRLPERSLYWRQIQAIVLCVLTLACQELEL